MTVLRSRRELQGTQQGCYPRKHLKCKFINSWDYHKLPDQPLLMQLMTQCVDYTDQRQLKGSWREHSKEEGSSHPAKDPSPRKEKGGWKSLGINLH